MHPLSPAARLWHALIGPAAVMAAGTMGAGAIAAFLLAGAWFRYELLWVLWLLLPLFVASADSASRLGALNPRQGIFSLVAQRLHPALAWLILLPVVPVHFLVSMGQLSVMEAALWSLTGLSDSTPAQSVWMRVPLSLLLASGVLWLVFSRGYQRLQRVMSLLMLLMLLCFLLVGLRGLSEWQAIVAGLVPALPPDLPVSGSSAAVRVASTSVLAMVGAAIAPAALLGLPYLSADAGGSAAQLRRSLHQSVLNLGLVFGSYAFLVLVAGAFALYPLPDHAQLADVAEASVVLRAALPGALSVLGPLVFSLGLFIAAMTTLVVAAQVTVYFLLDMLGMDWRFHADNRPFRRLLQLFVLGAAVLAPLWDFPSLLKVVLLMGLNVVVIPLVYAVLITLVNTRAVMGEHTAGRLRNLLLLIGLLLSLLLAVHKAPTYWHALAG
jgi:Mn2+/Fe2+ NRAMP family transporter